MVFVPRTFVVGLVCGLGGIASAVEDLSLPGRHNGCSALEAALPGAVAFPNTTSFGQSASYWSNQQLETRPRCFVSPKNTNDVSTILKVLTRGNWPFTVKGGGHIPFAGGSSIEDGVTIDMAHLNDIKVHPDRQTVSVGPGNRWINVTEILDPMGLAVVGGRDMNVGVSGLILGGGISHFSGLYGWACDNVLEYEVVLASGRIVLANPQENKDLYWALRGGGGLNFGIVTRFDLFAFAQGPLWENTLSFPGSANKSLVPLFQNLTTTGLPSDHDGSGYLVLNYHSDSRSFTTDVGFWHASVPSPPSSIPAAFQPFHDNATLSTANVIRTDPVSAFLREIATPYGRRWTWANVVVSATFPPQFLDAVLALFEQRNAAWFANQTSDEDIVPNALFQPIPVNVLAAMQKNGGNALGLSPSHGPLIMISFPTSWTKSSNDELVYGGTRRFVEQVQEKAREFNVSTPFVYMNYAGKEQEVQRGYGRENFERLRRVSREYDPRGELARLWKGYFKLDGRG